MGERLAGKKTIVSAVGQGIGLAIANMFVSEGARQIATNVYKAPLATNLAGDESAFATGGAIPVDGGWTL